MTAELSMSQIYYNPSILNFFFRKQAVETLEEVLNAFPSVGEGLDALETTFEDVDDMEEVLYSEDLPDILEMLAV